MGKYVKKKKLQKNNLKRAILHNLVLFQKRYRKVEGIEQVLKSIIVQHIIQIFRWNHQDHAI